LLYSPTEITDVSEERTSSTSINEAILQQEAISRSGTVYEDSCRDQEHLLCIAKTRTKSKVLLERQALYCSVALGYKQ
jgi:hypothetical protein